MDVSVLSTVLNVKYFDHKVDDGGGGGGDGCEERSCLRTDRLRNCVVFFRANSRFYSAQDQLDLNWIRSEGAKVVWLQHVCCV